MNGYYPAQQYGYGGGMGYGGGYPPSPYMPTGGQYPLTQPGAGAGAPAGTAMSLARPRTATFTVVTRVNEMGAVEVTDQFRGKPFLSPQDFRAFRKVIRLARRLKRLVPSRRRCKKGKR